MGYKYGIWLVYDRLALQNKTGASLNHIGHFTICCSMEYLDAYQLFHQLSRYYGETSTLHVYGKPTIFPSGFYKNATDELQSWGYEATCSLWPKYRDTCQNYECDFADVIHTSVQYYNDPISDNELTSKTIKSFSIPCDMCLADITSDDPSNWRILSH